MTQNNEHIFIIYKHINYNNFGKYNIFKFNFTVTSLKVLIAFNLKILISTLTYFQQNLEIHKLRENGVSKYVWYSM